MEDGRLPTAPATRMYRWGSFLGCLLTRAWAWASGWAAHSWTVSLVGGGRTGTVVGGPGSGFGCYYKGQEQTINNHTEEKILLTRQKLQENSPELGAGQGR